MRIIPKISPPEDFSLSEFLNEFYGKCLEKDMFYHPQLDNALKKHNLFFYDESINEFSKKLKKLTEQQIKDIYIILKITKI